MSFSFGLASALLRTASALIAFWRWLLDMTPVIGALLLLAGDTIDFAGTMLLGFLRGSSGRLGVESAVVILTPVFKD
jgi:hypothetical protein